MKRLEYALRKNPNRSYLKEFGYLDTYNIDIVNYDIGNKLSCTIHKLSDNSTLELDDYDLNIHKFGVRDSDGEWWSSRIGVVNKALERDLVSIWINRNSNYCIDLKNLSDLVDTSNLSILKEVSKDNEFYYNVYLKRDLVFKRAVKLANSKEFETMWKRSTSEIYAREFDSIFTSIADDVTIDKLDNNKFKMICSYVLKSLNLSEIEMCNTLTEEKLDWIFKYKKYTKEAYNNILCSTGLFYDIVDDKLLLNNSKYLEIDRDKSVIQIVNINLEVETKVTIPEAYSKGLVLLTKDILGLLIMNLLDINSGKKGLELRDLNIINKFIETSLDTFNKNIISIPIGANKLDEMKILNIKGCTVVITKQLNVTLKYDSKILKLGNITNLQDREGSVLFYEILELVSDIVTNN